MAFISTLKRLGLFGDRKNLLARRHAVLERAARPVIESLEHRQMLTVTYPSIAVTGLGHTIAYQDASPLTLDGTNFGSVDTKTSVVDTFVVKNTGAGVLNLTAFNHVQFTGANAADFTVVSQPPATLAPNAQSTFSVKFSPTIVGVETATVSIDNDTAGKDPFTFDIQGTGTQAPHEVVVGLASKVIASGDTTTIAADGTNFGNTESASGNVSETFTIKNTGSGVLTMSGAKVGVSGSGASAYSITTNAPGSIAAGASGTFVLKFTPGTAGAKVATVTLTSNDPTFPSDTFVVQGTGVSAPVIKLEGTGSTPIATGDTTTISGDGTSFGSADLVNGVVTHTFEILDIGANTLSLTGTPVVTLTGATTEFSVVTQPSNSVAPAGNETFQIKFAPGSVGSKTATVTIANNAGGTGHPFTFLVNGTGVSQPTMQVSSGGTNLTAGQSATSSLDGTDFGSAEIANATVSHTFTVKNLGSGALTFGGTPITITGADAADFTVTAAPGATVPGVAVSRVAATPLPSVPSGLNKEGHHAHAAALEAVGALVIPTGLNKEGHHAHAAALASASGAHIVGTAPASTTYGITFNPTTAGTKTATITLATNDPNSPTYSYVVTGLATDNSVLAVTGTGSTPILSGDVSPSLVDGTDFGTADETQTNSDTFTLADTGTETLNFTGGAVITGDTTDFTVATDAPASINSGTSANIVLAFAPTTTGSKTATVTLTTDDPASPYSFVVHGTAVSVPIEAVSGNTNSIAAGSLVGAVSSSNDTNFGNTELNLGTVSETYTVTNNGSNTLTFSGSKVHIAGANSNDFTVTTAPAATVAPLGGTTTFVVRFRPTAAGVRNATVQVLSNDSVAPTYSFAVQGTAVRQPAEQISGKGTPIVTGDTTTISGDGTNFGTADPAAGAFSTFTIHNAGSDALNISSIAFAGDNNTDFSVVTAPRVSVAAGASTTAVLEFIPTTVGAEDTTVTVNSDDPTNPAYTFVVGGTGAAASLVTIEGTGSTVIPVGDTTPKLADGTDFGQSVINNGTVSDTFTITNTGSASLTLTNPTLSGPNAGDFSIAADPTSPVVATTGTTSFVVKFAPTAVGSRTATVTLDSNDPNHGVYTFVIHGTGVTAPLMVVKGLGTVIANNDTTPSSIDGSDFGQVEEANGTVTDTFTIQNTGSASLSLTGTHIVAISGANSNDFTVVTQPSATVATSGSETFAIKFKPSAVGTRVATVSIASNDPTTSPYTFDIQGEAAALPVIQLFNGSHQLTNGETATLSDNTNFGSTEANNGIITQTFTIKNNGSATLNLDASDLVDISGVDAGDFVVGTAPATTVAAGSSTTFTISFSPTNIRAENALVTIGSDDPNGAFTFNIAGTGTL